MAILRATIMFPSQEENTALTMVHMFSLNKEKWSLLMGRGKHAIVSKR
jgi:hypothetical protein